MQEGGVGPDGGRPPCMQSRPCDYLTMVALLAGLDVRRGALANHRLEKDRHGPPEGAHSHGEREERQEAQKDGDPAAGQVVAKGSKATPTNSNAGCSSGPNSVVIHLCCSPCSRVYQFVWRRRNFASIYAFSCTICSMTSYGHSMTSAIPTNTCAGPRFRTVIARSATKTSVTSSQKAYK